MLQEAHQGLLNQHPSSWATSFSGMLSLAKFVAQIRHYCKRFSTKLCLKGRSLPTHCGESFLSHLKPVKMQPKDHRKGKIFIQYCCFQQSYSWLNEISREPSDLFYHVVGPKSLEKLKCSHISPRVSGRNRNMALKDRQKFENRGCQFIFHLDVLPSGTRYCISVRLHKEGFSFQMWVTCLCVTAITIPQAGNTLPSKCILAWPGKKPVLLLFKKAIPYLQRLQIRCLSVWSSSAHFK